MFQVKRRLVLTLHSDGTVTAQAADTLFAMNEDSLAAMMERYVRFTERTGQECMLLEFGFNSTIPYDVALSAADAFFSAADRCGLSWCSWVSDITTFRHNGKYYYVCVIIDLFSRKDSVKESSQN